MPHTDQPTTIMAFPQGVGMSLEQRLGSLPMLGSVAGWMPPDSGDEPSAHAGHARRREVLERLRRAAPGIAFMGAYPAQSWFLASVWDDGDGSIAAAVCLFASRTPADIDEAEQILQLLWGTDGELAAAQVHPTPLADLTLQQLRAVCAATRAVWPGSGWDAPSFGEQYLRALEPLPSPVASQGGDLWTRVLGGGKVMAASPLASVRLVHANPEASPPYLVFEAFAQDSPNPSALACAQFVAYDLPEEEGEAGPFAMGCTIECLLRLSEDLQVTATSLTYGEAHRPPPSGPHAGLVGQFLQEGDQGMLRVAPRGPWVVAHADSEYLWLRRWRTGRHRLVTHDRLASYKAAALLSETALQEARVEQIAQAITELQEDHPALLRLLTHGGEPGRISPGVEDATFERDDWKVLHHIQGRRAAGEWVDVVLDGPEGLVVRHQPAPRRASGGHASKEPSAARRVGLALGLAGLGGLVLAAALLLTWKVVGGSGAEPASSGAGGGSGSVALALPDALAGQGWVEGLQALPPLVDGCKGRGDCGYTNLVVSRTGGRMAGVTGMKPTAVVWEGRGDGAHQRFRVADDEVRGVAIAADGTRLAVTRCDNMGAGKVGLELLDPGTGRSLRSIAGGCAGEVALASERVAYVDESDQLVVLDADTLASSRTLEVVGGGVVSLAFSPSGSHLAASFSGSPKELRIWDLEEEGPAAVVAFPTEVAGAVAFSEAGDQIFLLGGGRVLGWSLSGGGPIHEVALGSPYAARIVPAPGYLARGPRVALGPGAGVVVVEGEGGLLHLFSAQSGAHLGILEGSPDGDVVSMAFSPQGDLLVVSYRSGELLRWAAIGQPPGPPSPTD